MKYYLRTSRSVTGTNRGMTKGGLREQRHVYHIKYFARRIHRTLLIHQTSTPDASLHAV